jgi:aminoglycoside phosphotransferase (APT) family kinase protein
MPTASPMTSAASSHQTQAGTPDDSSAGGGAAVDVVVVDEGVVVVDEGVSVVVDGVGSEVGEVGDDDEDDEVDDDDDDVVDDDEVGVGEEEDVEVGGVVVRVGLVVSLVGTSLVVGLGGSVVRVGLMLVGRPVIVRDPVIPGRFSPLQPASSIVPMARTITPTTGPAAPRRRRLGLVVTPISSPLAAEALGPGRPRGHVHVRTRRATPPDRGERAGRVGRCGAQWTPLRSSGIRLSSLCWLVQNRRMAPSTDGRAGITAGLVRRLVQAQFPQWGDLPIEPVELDGWDNRTYRMGDALSVRLPTAQGYVAAVSKEATFLPQLAPHLPVAVPEVLALGEPGEGYPFPWSVRRWLPGEPVSRRRPEDLSLFAQSVAGFLVALRGCDAAGGPHAGEHSWFRGATPAHYDEQTRRDVDAVDGLVDRGRALDVWEAALEARWTSQPVWFHGDIAVGNLLVRDGRLAAVIDFGTSGVGDPACDLVIAWTLFSGTSRVVFREAVAQDEGTWARARGWALWKALLGLAEAPDKDGERARAERRLVADILDDHDRAQG